MISVFTTTQFIKNKFEGLFQLPLLKVDNNLWQVKIPMIYENCTLPYNVIYFKYTNGLLCCFSKWTNERSRRLTKVFPKFAKSHAIYFGSDIEHSTTSGSNKE